MEALTGPAVVRERVRDQLGRVSGVVTTGENGVFLVARGTGFTGVQVVGLQPDVTLVVVFAVVATEVARVDPACRFLATRALDLPLVHFELVDDGKTLIAVHGLLGEFVSGPDLAAAVDAVSAAAETWGPEVRERFGGRAVIDAVAPGALTQPRQQYPPVRGPSEAPERRSWTAPRSRVAAFALTALGVALVVAAWIWWGAGSALAAVLVLGPLWWALGLSSGLRGGHPSGSAT